MIVPVLGIRGSTGLSGYEGIPATIRRKLVSVPASSSASARGITLHVPEHQPGRSTLDASCLGEEPDDRQHASVIVGVDGQPERIVDL